MCTKNKDWCCCKPSARSVSPHGEMVWWEVCMEEESVQCPFLCFMESECISRVDQGLVPSAPLGGVGRNSLLVEGSVLKLLLNRAAEYRTDQPTVPWINGGTDALSHHTKTWNVSAAVLCVFRYPRVCLHEVKYFTIITCLERYGSPPEWSALPQDLLQLLHFSLFIHVLGCQHRYYVQHLL